MAETHQPIIQIKMKKLFQPAETQIFIYQLLILLNIFFAIIAIIYVLKNDSKFKYPSLLLFLIIFTPFVVSVPMFFALRKKSNLSKLN